MIWSIANNTNQGNNLCVLRSLIGLTIFEKMSINKGFTDRGNVANIQDFPDQYHSKIKPRLINNCIIEKHGSILPFYVF